MAARVPPGGGDPSLAPLSPVVLEVRRRRSRRWWAIAVLSGVVVGGAAVTGGVVGIGIIASDPFFASPDTCQERADADFAVHTRLVVPFLVGTVGPRESVDCDSGGADSSSTIVDTTPGVTHEAALSQLARRGWQRVDPTADPLGRTESAVAYRTTVDGNTVFAVADDPRFGSETPVGSITTVEIWTDH